MKYIASPTIQQLYFDTPPRQVDQHLESLFFSRLRVANGVFKTTTHGRLDDVNQRLFKWLPRQRRLNIMDVAVSSGISTLEWMHHLNAKGISHEMTAGDVAINLEYVTVARGVCVLVDRDGIPLQLDVGSISFPNASGSRWRNACFKFGQLFLRPMLFLDKHSQCSRRDQERRFSLSLPRRPLKLVSPALLEHGAQITVLEDDIAVRTPELDRRFDVVRAANILNSVYFDTSTLKRMARNLKRRLVSGGLLVICRTDPKGMNHGGIFRLNERHSLQILESFGDGADAAILTSSDG
ncbi:MAG: hypothetical protein ACQESR_11765 [Planctomycetota bacterium]